MPIELKMLAYSAALCLLLAVPYTLGFIVERGMPKLLGNRDDFAPGTGWIGRAQRAHRNMIENLVPFAALAAELFFYARLGHAVVYIAGIPGLRTLAYALGLVATLMLLGALLG